VVGGSTVPTSHVSVLLNHIELVQQCWRVAASDFITCLVYTSQLAYSS